MNDYLSKYSDNIIDSYDIDKYKHALNVEVVRRLLIKYFMEKGFTDSFDRQMCPSLLQDLPLAISVIANKIEIIPHAVDVDTVTGKAVVGWNLFVLGLHRMYLGETYHMDLQDLARQLRAGYINDTGNARRQTTPRRVITFITRVLGDHEAGYVDLRPTAGVLKQPGDTYGAGQTMLGMPQQFFTRTSY